MIRERAGGLAIQFLLESLARAGRYLPSARAQLRGVSIVRNVAYAPGGEHHLLDVYSTRPGPALLYIHGGSFRILNKDTHWAMAALLAQAGFTVFNINYRLSPAHRYPSALQDVALAYQWVVDNAHRYHGDPSKLVVAGESAGANLTLGITLAACFERGELPFDAPPPVAIAPMCGVFQVSDGARFLRRKAHMKRIVSDRLLEMENAYLAGVALGEYPLADPLLLLESDLQPRKPLPAVYAAVGTADPLLDDTRRLEKALVRRGVEHQVSYFPGEIHAFHALLWREAAQRCWKEQIAFLNAKIAGSGPGIYNEPHVIAALP